MCWRFLICWLGRKEISGSSSVFFCVSLVWFDEELRTKNSKNLSVSTGLGHARQPIFEAGIPTSVGDKCHKMQGIAHLTWSRSRGRIHKS